MSERKGFAAVFDSCFEQIHGYVAYRLWPDVEAAADLTQEVFLAALAAWESYRGNGLPLSWLRQIARRKVADYFRARPRRDADLAGEMPAPSAPADASAAEAEQAALVCRVMQSIGQDYADLLEEKYLDGLSAQEIAERRGKSQKAIESALARARGAFRQAYEKRRPHEENSR